MTENPPDVSTWDYERICKVGSGAFATVWKCRNKQTNKIFAVKNMILSIETLLAMTREIPILRAITVHERLIEYYGFKMEGISLLIFTEFMPQGSLRDVMGRTGVISAVKAAKYTREILEGLTYLHENNIIHRDIKCGNILLNDLDHVKLADFGLSKCVDNASFLENHTVCGTMYFMSPELLEKNEYSCSADIWSLGVTVVEMLTGYPIYMGLPPILFVLKITGTGPIETQVSRDLKTVHYFLKLTFVKDPAGRPKARDLLHCRFVLSAQS